MGNNKETVSVIGLGYVGLPLAILAAQKGYSVIGIDKDKSKLEIIKNKKSPFVDKKIERNLKSVDLMVFSDCSETKKSGIIVICVPTPVHKNYLPNLEPVESACRDVAPYIRKGDLVILESTVNPGVSERVVLPILEEVSGLRCGIDFHLSHCPERINPGDPKWNVENIPRVVGSFDAVGLKKTVKFYNSILTANVKPMNSLKEAEACKIIENSFRDINIAFVNELAKSFNRLGIDVKNVIDGAATKPFAFMAHYPSCGVGGHCIPVDPYYLIEYAKQNGFYHEFLSTARRINNSMPIFTVDMVVEGLNDVRKAIKNSKVVVLGLAYKADIGDDRESPSYKVIKELKRRGAEVETFDPFVEKKSTLKTLEDALGFAEVVVIATNHKIFKELIPKTLKKYGIKVVVDGKNCLDKDELIRNGIVYKGIGR